MGVLRMGYTGYTPQNDPKDQFQWSNGDLLQLMNFGGYPGYPILVIINCSYKNPY